MASGISRSPATGVTAGGGDDEEATWLHALELISGFTVSMTLKAAIQLGLIDALTAAADGRALTAGELVAQLPAVDDAEAATSVDRMLRLLASFNVVRCSTEAGPGGDPLRRYSPAPVCRWFTAGDNHQGSLAPRLMLDVDEDNLSTWHQMAAAVVSGGPSAFERAHGMPLFEYMGTNHRFNTLFNQAMSQQSMMVMNKLLDRFHGFDGIGILVDVGGGTGVTLEMIISRYKHITGVNFDLPHVIAQAPSLPGVNHVAGNMFESVPKGDAIFLKLMLLRNDEECIKILKNCHCALSDNGKVIVVDIVLPVTPKPVPEAQNPLRMDVMMLNNLRGGKIRAEQEYAKLAMDSGFSGSFRTTYIFANFMAIELCK
ncbi:probable inactive methyltransferase Os04g0175900 [Oryza glaberrima]|uniref:O-methyltransferase domain-containing protein n=2 Tax=Oryza TaxID=4527 RepID=A0A0D3FSL5_9ORYZ|nr:probable inactive methyltransferase Os04g0175900 [Oryza glaberrima]